MAASPAYNFVTEQIKDRRDDVETGTVSLQVYGDASVTDYTAF